ncbi:hypothetical protein I6A60_13690 [Frankia sp. AgB1.9]|uniref:hypothetical protein n=1 Tax=unclassified Frankia TaxID=2632575 RepID=UPI0019314C89|nr:MULTISPECIES: hypothetical protein [unclassified Frankia]MBL7487610.1 hypothetical protein [Frankia sp. AgW1.1]MBL7548924.1 hypothetical protein [Frankia sp. AgB1.9]MBL7624892.1 hypothetical protein [Frankia sp. AgB1.8]
MNRHGEESAVPLREDARAIAGSPYAARLVTALVVVVVGLTFLFGFGNSFDLGLRLGVPVFIAPLVAPAVDLSVVGLLLGLRQLAVHGDPAGVGRSARRLLVFASVVTLALNIAEPLLAGRYGKAAFDAVGPLLMIGWAEVAPGLIQAMHPTKTSTPPPSPPPADTAMPSDQPASSTQARRNGQGKTPSEGGTSPQVESGAREQDLLHRARAEDVLHWQHHRRPISAATLRDRLHVSAGTARTLVDQLRTDTHTKIEDTAGPPGETG